MYNSIVRVKLIFFKRIAGSQERKTRSQKGYDTVKDFEEVF
jgi:hypothetical protein